MMKSIYGKLICGFLITIAFSFSVAGYVALRNNYDQIEDIVSVGLSKYRDNYTQKYNQESPFILYEKYSRKDVCLLMDVEKDISSTMYGMAQIRNDVFIFVTYLL